MSDNKRLIDKLGQAPPKQPEVEMTTETSKIEGGEFPNRMIKEAGNKLAPDGSDRVGSFCVHVYKHAFSENLSFICQKLGRDNNVFGHEVKSHEANAAIQQLAINVAKSYGWQPGRQQAKRMKER